MVPGNHGSRVLPPRCRPRPLDPTPWERPLDAPGLQRPARGAPTPAPLSGRGLCCLLAAQAHGAAQAPFMPVHPGEAPSEQSQPSLQEGPATGHAGAELQTGKALETGTETLPGARGEGGPSRSSPAPSRPGTADSAPAARPSPGPPQAYLVLGHGVQTGLVGGQHQVLLDLLVDLHQDGAVLHGGAAVGGQVRLRQGQVREGAVPSETALQPRPQPRPQPLPLPPAPAPGFTLRTWPSEVPRKAMVWPFSVATVTAVRFRPPRCSTAVATSPLRLPRG